MAAQGASESGGAVCETVPVRQEQGPGLALEDSALRGQPGAATLGENRAGADVSLAWGCGLGLWLGGLKELSPSPAYCPACPVASSCGWAVLPTQSP